MLRKLLLLVLCWWPLVGQSNTIYKCMKDGKVVFSQNACPDDFSQHRIEYQLGITTETDTDRRVQANDPLKDILSSGGTISVEKLLQLLDGELYRLKQENSYFDIIRVSEIQKLERKLYWDKLEKTDPKYLAELAKTHQRYDELIASNLNMIKLLNDRKMQILAAMPEPE
ncbi:DUF4124 domain-containing protein [Shewanella sp. SR44-3]|uniref:DUF4124 domain-containing protein n=1 Tax=unclassified Shewanella TaxID=196818 RepID=UPI0015FDC6A2|nr:DUF4124 domain-containing protein [Shewanella sp. SR44-3]MBB1268261.1 DUF4124 domain-containing protein [Shewanella sp. SR44-3]